MSVGTAVPRVTFTRALLQHLQELLTTFSPKRLTFDSHVELFVAGLDDPTAASVRSFAPLVHRRLPLLHTFADALLAFAPAATLRDDRDLYALFAWALLFAGEDVVEAVRSFVDVVPKEKYSALATALEFAVEGGHLHDWVVLEWAKVLDIRYIEEKILGSLARAKERLLVLLAEVRTRAMIKNPGDTCREVYTTKVEPFNLSENTSKRNITQTNNKIFPFQPILPKRRHFSEKLPEKKKVEPTIGEMPKLLAMQRPSRRQPDAQPLPPPHPRIAKASPPAPAAPLVHTVTSVLRLHAQITKQQTHEWREIERYLTELRDSAEYDEWRAAMEEADRIRDERRLQERKKEAEQARLDAIEAQHRSLERRRREVQEETERKLRERQRFEAERLEQLEKMQNLVQDVRVEERVKPTEAVESVKRRNKQEAELLKRHKDEEERRVRLEKAKELALKKDLISSIRALEKVSIVRPASFDPSEPPKHGLLEEMSIAELRERLEIANLENEREIERRRKNIQNERANKWGDLKMKWAEIAQVRETRKRARNSRVM